jgi:hypothetical protein
MKEAKDRLVITPKQDTISGSLGISPERRIKMQKTIEKICKEEMEKPKGNNSTVIKRVWDEFENPQECAFAMYILTHAEEEVSVHQLFKLPESVEAEN